MVLPTPGGPMNNTLVASSTKRRVASSAMRAGSTLGWALYSKSARVNGEGSEAKRARLDRRRSSTASTSTASSRSSSSEWLRRVVLASSSSPGRASAAAPMRKKARWARSRW